MHSNRFPTLMRTTTALLVGSLFCAPAQAASVLWRGSGDSFWDVVTDWSSNPLLPGAADDVTIDGGVPMRTITHRSGANAVNTLHAAANLVIAGGALVVSGAASNSGATVLQAGELTLNGQASLGALELVSGTLGGSGALSVSGGFAWRGGVLSGSGATSVGGSASISGTSVHDLRRRTLDLAGTTTWTNASGGSGGQIRLGDGARITNSGTFLDQIAFGSSINANLGGGGTFDNAGSYIKSGVGTTEIRTIFHNGAVALPGTGVLNVDTGTLKLTGGGTSTGTIDIAAGATLEFGGNVFDLANADGVAAAGRLLVSAGALNLSGALRSTGTIEIVGGTLDVGGAVATTGFVQSAGILAGTGVVTIDDTGSWSGGTMSGSGTTRVGAAATFAISGGGVHDMTQRTLALAGTTTWTNVNSVNGGQIRLGSGAQIENAGSFLDQTAFDTSINPDLGNGGPFTNTGTYAKTGSGTTSIRVGFDNRGPGVVRVDAGTMVFERGITGDGVLQIGPAGRVNLAAVQSGLASAVGILRLEGAAPNALQLGRRTISIATDYDNASFGAGNAFDRRAGIDIGGGGPAQRLLAAGNADQALSGAAVIDGAGATPSIVIGNVHVGTTRIGYDIDNTGTSGPSLRGAIQDAANGGRITDARLSGNGVLAGNWGPLAPGDSLEREVMLVIDTAGVYAPIEGQAVGIVNNFENTRSQLLSIRSAPGAAAYNLAAANTLADVVIGNQRLGAAPLTQALSLTNVAPGGSFSEHLAAAVAGTAGSATAAGSFGLLAAQADDRASLTVGVDNSVAGVRSGTVTLSFLSDGALTSGLGRTALAPQTIAVAGTVYRLASPASNTANVTLVARVGDPAPSAGIGITNRSADAFTERLDAGFGAVDAPFGGAGRLSGLAAGATDDSALRVSLGTAASVAATGSAKLTFVSSGLGTTGAPDQSVGGAEVVLHGRVYAPARAGVPAAIDFGIVHRGDRAVRAIEVGNTAAPAALNDVLASLSFAAGAGFSASGSLSGIAAASSDAASLQLELDTSDAGFRNGTATLQLVSRNPELPDLVLPVSSILLQAQVNAFANPVLMHVDGAGTLISDGTGYLLDLGSVVAGTEPLSASLRLVNDVQGPADELAGSFAFGGASVFSFAGFDAFSGLGAGAATGPLGIAFDPALRAVGRFSERIVLSAMGSNASGYAAAFGDIPLTVIAEVSPVPEPQVYVQMLLGLGVVGLLLRRRAHGRRSASAA